MERDFPKKRFSKFGFWFQDPKQGFIYAGTIQGSLSCLETCLSDKLKYLIKSDVTDHLYQNKWGNKFWMLTQNFEVNFTNFSLFSSPLPFLFSLYLLPFGFVFPFFFFFNFLGKKDINSESVFERNLVTLDMFKILVISATHPVNERSQRPKHLRSKQIQNFFSHVTVLYHLILCYILRCVFVCLSFWCVKW